jgi:hypothetical protein
MKVPDVELAAAAAGHFAASKRCNDNMRLDGKALKLAIDFCEKILYYQISFYR